MSRRALRLYLHEASALSERIAQLKHLSSSAMVGDNNCTQEVEALVERARHLTSSITVDTLGAELPGRSDLEAMTAPMYYADIFQSENFHVCLFGFKNCGFKLPLHNHPDMYGFVKVIRGAVSVNSYTELHHDEQEEIKQSRGFALSPDVIAARYEGNSKLWISDDCIYLKPTTGNIHSVAAIEDGTAFFDLLIPGYRHDPCTYYKVVSPKRKNICLLQKIGEPEDYFCQLLPYETIKSF